MLGLLDFRDGITDIFRQLPENRRPLSDLSGKQIILDTLGLNSVLQTSRHLLRFYDNLLQLKDELALYKASLFFVQRGIEIIDQLPMMSPCRIFLNFVETFHYSMMMHSLLMTIDDSSRAKYAEELQNLARFKDDAFAGFIVNYRYHFNIQNAIIKLGIPFMIAPQLTENQVAYLLKQSSNRIGMSSPTIFMCSDEVRIIDRIDCQSQTFTFFNIEQLAQHYKTSVTMLRKCMLAAALSILNSGQTVNVRFFKQFRRDSSPFLPPIL